VNARKVSSRSEFSCMSEICHLGNCNARDDRQCNLEVAIMVSWVMDLSQTEIGG